LETEPEQPWQVVTLVGATTEENIEAAPYLHREKLANIVSGYAQVAGFAVYDTAATKP